MPLRSSVLLIGGFLLASLAGSGCAPDSSGSSAPPDTTTVSATTTSSAPAEPSTEPASPPSGDDARTVAERLDDASVEARVTQALVRTRALRQFTFSPTVIRGHLTLRGDVNTREQYQQAERIASNVEGVTEITNQVTVEGRAVSEDGDTAGTAYHTVRRGDTLTEIARAYGVSVRRLRALNDLSGSLQPGQRIRVR
jgi:LysM repeat protein